MPKALSKSKKKSTVETVIMPKQKNGKKTKEEFRTRIRYYKPDTGEHFDRIYQDSDRVTQWRDHYLKQGVKSRKLRKI